MLIDGNPPSPVRIPDLESRMAKQNRKNRKRAPLRPEERQFLHAMKMLEVAEARARRASALLSRWQEKVRLLKAGHKERIQPSLFDPGPNTGDDLFLAEIQIHENSGAIGDHELGTEAPTE
jgi:hypothetical protein